MKTYTICGSMKFAEDMKKIAYDLEISKGYNILPVSYTHLDVYKRQGLYCEAPVFAGTFGVKGKWGESFCL